MVEDDSGVVSNLPVLISINGKILVELVYRFPISSIARGQKEVDFVVDVVLRQIQILHNTR